MKRALRGSRVLNVGCSDAFCEGSLGVYSEL